MTERELEMAIVGLEGLLDESDVESDYQSLFESHPIILRVLGYDQAIARPRLHLERGGYYEPDFLARTPRDLWEVIDLKLPSEQLLLDRERRERFTARLSDYIAQVHEYAEYFDDVTHRTRAAAEYGADVQPSPDMLIVGGRDASTDKREVFRQLRRLSARVEIATYDDVLAALQRQHALVTRSGAAVGIGSFLHLALENPSERRRGYLFDFDGPSGNRLSLYLDEHRRLVFEVRTRQGQVLAVPANVPTHTSMEPLLVSVEAGSTDDEGVLQLRLNDRLAGEIRLARPDLSEHLEFTRGRLGASLDPEPLGGWFGMFEWTLNSPVGFRDRLRLLEYFFAKEAEGPQNMVYFDGNAWMDIQNLEQSPIRASSDSDE